MLNLLGSSVQKLQDIQKRVEGSFEQVLLVERQSRSESTGKVEGEGSEHIDDVVSSRESEDRTISDENPEPQAHSTETRPRGDLVTQNRLMAELRAENEQLLSEGSRLSKRLALLEEKNRDRLKETESAVRSRTEAESRLQRSEEDRKRSQERIKHLETLLNQAKEASSKLQKEAADCKSTIDPNQLEAMRQEVSGLKDENCALLQAVNAYENENEKLRLYFGEQISIKESDNSYLRRYIRELEDRISAPDIGEGTLIWKTTEAELSVTTVNNNSVNVMDESMQNKLKEASKALTEMEQKWRASRDRVSDLEIEIGQMRVEAIDRTNAMLKLDARLSASEAVRASFSESLQVEIDTRESSNSEELDLWRKRCDSLSAELNRITAEKQSQSQQFRFSGNWAPDDDLRRKFEIALQAIGKLTDDLEEAHKREQQLRLEFHNT